MWKIERNFEDLRKQSTNKIHAEKHFNNEIATSDNEIDKICFRYSFKMYL